MIERCIELTEKCYTYVSPYVVAAAFIVVMIIVARLVLGYMHDESEKGD